MLLLITTLIGSHDMKTEIHYGNKVSTVKGSTVYWGTELELFDKMQHSNVVSHCSILKNHY